MNARTRQLGKRGRRDQMRRAAIRSECRRFPLRIIISPDPFQEIVMAANYIAEAFEAFIEAIIKKASDGSIVEGLDE